MGIGRNRSLLLGMLVALALGVFAVSCASEQAPAYWDGPTVWEPEDISSLVSITQELVPPPAVPRHSQTYSGRPRIVKVRMDIEEKEIEIAPGVFTWAFTLQRHRPRPPSRGPRRRLRRAYPVEPLQQQVGPQHRLPLLHRGLGRRRTDPRSPRPRHGAALPGN